MWKSRENLPQIEVPDNPLVTRFFRPVESVIRLFFMNL
jgi:hypothetical protein